MSVHISSRVWCLQLDPVAKLVLLKLADCADDSGANAYPSVGRLAIEVGVSERTIQRHLHDLEAAGIIEVLRPAHRYCPTNYRVRPDRGARLSPLEEPRGDTGDGSGVTSTTSRGDTAVSPDPSLDPSLDPSNNATRRTRREKAAGVIDPKPVVPLTENALQELRDRFGERLRDFDEVIDYWRGDTRFRMQADKPAFLARKLEEKAERDAARAAERSTGTNGRYHATPQRRPSQLDELRALGIVQE